MVALLGLEFEMPDRVWVAVCDEGAVCGTLDGEDFLFAAPSEDGLKRALSATRRHLENVPLIDVCAEVETESLEQDLKTYTAGDANVVGIALFDEDGIAVGRRYVHKLPASLPQEDK